MNFTSVVTKSTRCDMNVPSDTENVSYSYILKLYSIKQKPDGSSVSFHLMSTSTTNTKTKDNEADFSHVQTLSELNIHTQ